MLLSAPLSLSLLFSSPLFLFLRAARDFGHPANLPALAPCPLDRSLFGNLGSVVFWSVMDAVFRFVTLLQHALRTSLKASNQGLAAALGVLGAITRIISPYGLAYCMLYGKASRWTESCCPPIPSPSPADAPPCPPFRACSPCSSPASRHRR